MTMTSHDTTPPWHHWPVAIAGLVFYAVAALDYVLTKLRIGAYLRNFPEEFNTSVQVLPFWLTVVWAIVAWGGLLGAWLHFQRNRYAVMLLFAGALGLGILTVWLSLFIRPTIFATSGVTGFYALIGATGMATLLYLYARWERSERKLV